MIRKLTLILTLTALTLAAGCSKQPESFDGKLNDGLYAYYGPNYIIAIGTCYKDGWTFDTYCEPGYITITDTETAGYIFTQTQSIINGCGQDGYPYWSYNNGLTIARIPTAADSFTGVVVNNTSGIQLPDKLDFRQLR